MSEELILDALKRTVARGRAEFGRALTGVTGVVLSDEDFLRACAECAERYHPEDPERFQLAHSVWFDITTANGKTRFWRHGSLARALIEQGFPIPPGDPKPVCPVSSNGRTPDCGSGDSGSTPDVRTQSGA